MANLLVHLKKRSALPWVGLLFLMIVMVLSATVSANSKSNPSSIQSSQFNNVSHTLSSGCRDYSLFLGSKKSSWSDAVCPIRGTSQYSLFIYHSQQGHPKFVAEVPLKTTYAEVPRFCMPHSEGGLPRINITPTTITIGFFANLRTPTFLLKYGTGNTNLAVGKSTGKWGLLTFSFGLNSSKLFFGTIFPTTPNLRVISHTLTDKPKWSSCEEESSGTNQIMNEYKLVKGTFVPEKSSEQICTAERTNGTYGIPQKTTLQHPTFNLPPPVHKESQLLLSQCNDGWRLTEGQTTSGLALNLQSFTGHGIFGTTTGQAIFTAPTSLGISTSQLQSMLTSAGHALGPFAKALKIVQELPTGDGQFTKVDSGIVKVDGVYWFATANVGKSYSIYKWSQSQKQWKMVGTIHTKRGSWYTNEITPVFLTGNQTPDFALTYATGKEGYISVASDLDGSWRKVSFSSKTQREMAGSLGTTNGLIKGIWTVNGLDRAAYFKDWYRFTRFNEMFVLTSPEGLSPSCTTTALQEQTTSTFEVHENYSRIVCKGGWAAALDQSSKTPYVALFEESETTWINMANIPVATVLPRKKYPNATDDTVLFHFLMTGLGLPADPLP